jgi:hypothetical protein
MGSCAAQGKAENEGGGMARYKEQRLLMVGVRRIPRHLKSFNVRFTPESRHSALLSARAMSFTNGCLLICINAVAWKHKLDVLATRQHVDGE